MEDNIEVTFDGLMSLEWTIPQCRTAGYKRIDNALRVGNAEYTLRLICSHDDDYSMVISGCGEPSLFEVTVYFSKGTDKFLPRTTIIEDTESATIWKSSKYEMSRLVPGFERQRVWCFKIIVNMTPGQNPLPDNTGCLKSLVQDLHKLHRDSPDHDVRLRCNGQVLPAHKIILSARSKVFQAMFQADMLENQTGLVDVHDMDFPALQHFLTYLYTGTLPELTLELAVELYEAADKYAVDALKEWCAESLKSRLEDDNVCRILLLSNAHGDRDLKKSTFRYMKENDVPKKWGGWRDFSDRHRKLAIEFLNYLYK